MPCFSPYADMRADAATLIIVYALWSLCRRYCCFFFFFLHISPLTPPPFFAADAAHAAALLPPRAMWLKAPMPLTLYVAFRLRYFLLRFRHTYVIFC